MKQLIKSALLWLNAWRFKCSEDDALYARSVQANSYEQELVDGGDADYFAWFRMTLSAQEYRARLKQKKLKQQRKRIAEW